MSSTKAFVIAASIVAALICAENVRATQMTSGTLSAGKTSFVDFDTSPFPFHGSDPTKDKPFLDVNTDNRMGHTSGRGGIYWEDETYSDKKSLLFIPARFDIAKPSVIVVFFHGNQATLSKDVVQRQQVPRQLAESGLNAVLVAPQFAVNALDSSAGHFWETGAFHKYLREAAGHLSDLFGQKATTDVFDNMPVILVAYSGGYLPAAFSLSSGEVDERIFGVILLDALYGETDKFVKWIISRQSATFFFSAYSKSSNAENSSLKDSLSIEGIKISTNLPQKLSPGTISFIKVPDPVVHNDFVSSAWTTDPLKDVLSKTVLPVKPTLVVAENPANSPAPKAAAQPEPISKPTPKVLTQSPHPPMEQRRDEAAKEGIGSEGNSFGSYLIWIGAGGLVLTVLFMLLSTLFSPRRIR